MFKPFCDRMPEKFSIGPFVLLTENKIFNEKGGKKRKKD